jgi:hypothetical protein
MGAVFPNPVVNKASIPFTLQRDGIVEMNVYDVAGRRVASAKRSFPAGLNSVTWDRRDAHGAVVASGVFFVEMIMEGQRFRSKLVLVK